MPVGTSSGLPLSRRSLSSRNYIPLLLALSACSAPIYELDEPIEGPETFQCGGYSEDLGLQYYYNAALFEDGSTFVNGAVSDGLGSSSGTLTSTLLGSNWVISV